MLNGYPYDVTVAIKKVSNTDNEQQLPTSLHGATVRRVTRPHARSSNDVRFSPEGGDERSTQPGSTGVDGSSESPLAADATATPKPIRLRARWQRIEGVGLQCVWESETRR
jgi:hypothetical protein